MHMFSKEITRNNLESAGFDEDDLEALLTALDSSPDELHFRKKVGAMRFSGEYPATYDSDMPWYKALACISGP